MRALTAGGVRAARVRAQGLGDDPATSVLDAVRRVVGLQAQDVRASRLAVRARTIGLTASDVDQAVARRRVVRTWAMRGTLHMLAAEDHGWLVGLLGPYFAKGLAGRRRALGLDQDTCARGVEAVRAVLGEAGKLERAELVERIADHGVVLDPKSQAPAHLLGYAAMTGVICRGPETAADEPTYVLVRDWIEEAGDVLPEDAAMARLARRYLAGYGPATAGDLASWSGLPVGRCRQAFADIDAELAPVSAGGEPAFVLAGTELDAPGHNGVRLLGHFDTYLLGYHKRRLAVPERFDRRIQTGGGFIMPAVLDGGRAVGTWRQVRRRNGLVVAVEPFTTIARRALPALRAEVASVGQFLNLPAELDLRR
ncbi:MAG TPA: winged helix DNA-binding domain-containing protein [Actinophytocola sp.]|uniref:winged helix DNA-binding domain-containing protein n=1 Tax=Actinophytocola sp. TaxID=1872138 RepID=UPI002DB9286B|nr:winged helix DNA-binding domain-containing protein [Actinophytocola sp.]HEU5474754.1 winged helix DNA-binding domain-containing protein [Actinophytocola sp.]